MKLSTEVERNDVKVVKGDPFVFFASVMFIADTRQKTQAVVKTPREPYPAAYPRIEDIVIVRCAGTSSCLTGDER
jgi:hypothetical protein